MAKVNTNSIAFRDLDKKLWQNIIESLALLKRIYQLGNYIISFGTIQILRKMAAKNIDEEDIIIEVGPGPGTFLKLLKEYAKQRFIIGIEPSVDMAYYSYNKNGFADVLIGIAEKLPFRDNSIDIIYCVFSFRDFFDKLRFIHEAYRILKPGGKLIIVETNNPNKLSTKVFLSFVKVIGQALSILFLSRKNLYLGLYESIRKLQKVEYYIYLLKNIGFSRIVLRRYVFNHAYILMAFK